MSGSTPVARTPPINRLKRGFRKLNPNWRLPSPDSSAPGNMYDEPPPPPALRAASSLAAFLRWTQSKPTGRHISRSTVSSNSLRAHQSARMGPARVIGKQGFVPYRRERQSRP